MSFHLSATDIWLEHGHILHAKLGNGDGEDVDAQINLNNYVGNNFGSFQWGGENFSETAENISFELEGDDNVPVLRAELGDGDGNTNAANLNLSERIGNENGQFNFA